MRPHCYEEIENADDYAQTREIAIGKQRLIDSEAQILTHNNRPVLKIDFQDRSNDER
ncbi:hypothetical protein [Allocoleopsis sp.]|uniref:hypothetical protein n=1 Tax=Allocoleopsis sp. TaxID=3088169 RepID=UPI002FD5106E